VANVIWCTGYVPRFHWIDLLVFGEHEPLHERGMVPSQPGLYFVGLHFQYALSSSMLRGGSRDAGRVVRAIATRQAGTSASVWCSPQWPPEWRLVGGDDDAAARRLHWGRRRPSQLTPRRRTRPAIQRALSGSSNSQENEMTTPHLVATRF
jgi:hypothetical protein